MAETRFQVRVWTGQGGTGWRTLNLKYVASAQWRILLEGGYGDATLVLNGSLTDAPFSGIVRGLRIEFMGANPGEDWTRLYRGYIRFIQETEAPRGRRNATHKKQVTLTLYGIWERASKQIARQRYAFPDETDLAVAFSRILSKWAKPKLLGTVNVYSQPCGAFAEQMDGWRKTCGELVSGLLQLAGGNVAVGGDADPLDTLGITDRLFFRPFGSAASPDHVFPMPVPPNSYWNLLEVQKASDERNVANVVDFRGGKHRFFNQTHRDSGFEYPVFATAETANLLTDPSFDARSGSWSLLNGASFKSAGLTEGPTDSGGTMVELDALTELVAQNQNPPPTTITVGHQYTAVARVRLGAGGDVGMEATLTLIFYDVSNAVLGTATLVIAPQAAVFDTYTVSAIAPATCTGIGWKCECTTDIGGSASLMVDNAAVFDSDLILQEEMRLYSNGNTINAVNFAYEPDSHEGAYSCHLDVTITQIAPLNFVALSWQGTGRPSFGNEALRFSVWVKNAPGGSTVPAMNLHAVTRQGDTLLNQYDQAFIAASHAGWTRYSLTFTTDASTDKVGLAVQITGNGSLLMDAITLRDQAADADEYVEGGDGGVWEAVYRADTLVGSGPVHDSNGDFGDIPTLLDLDTGTTDAIAQRFATSAVNSRATAIEKPILRLVARAIELWPGQYVRTVGSLGADVMPDPEPIAEVEGQWDGKITLTVYFNEPRPSEVRTQRQIAREAALRVGAHL